ncbi:iron-containing alcohol dehydrogenase family protein [Ruminiclostridium cellulolyticum]|uniref:3-dehydroquinate synthase n=1 Tax=Ruminiclostridium cellulolyticum (strain ATCC 35319 / DSM 5812 / JCM 6584 / H10) TaxID=394503 RepID=B8I649_RUMCH|nr:iron-containing alcohol dehydrogenase family protein [Ruminiclostridium cellulolyticum]ACL76814.1 3-dehydroquinate synthase [Ruminiclostridium cellulolyticum H10]
MTYVHRIEIPSILEVSNNILGSVGAHIERAGISNVVVLFGEGIRDLFGEKILDSIKSRKSLAVLETYDYDDIKLENLMLKAFTIPSKTDAVVGVGGGKVLDAAKYIAFLNKLPFISIPTSTSNDGFSSSGCSLIINGRRTSVHASMPFGILVDLDVLKNAPMKFIYSGLGDIISKITAVYDWYFEERNNAAKVDDFAAMIAKKSVNSIVRMPYTQVTENFFLKEMVDSLTMSGIAMQIADSSAPASGSEHLISHALDKLLETPQLHGIQVGIATYLMSRVQEHRYQRVVKFLTDTGFINFVETLKMKADDFEKAIDMAHTIKPNRYTYLHVPENREKAKQLLRSDDVLKRILV